MQTCKKLFLGFLLFFVSTTIMAQKKVNDNWIDWANFK